MTQEERNFNKLKLSKYIVECLKEKKSKSEYIQERWLSEKDDETCPICVFLSGLGFVSFGALPDYREAHSKLGGPNWKSSDAECRCGIDYKRGKSENIQTFAETEQLWFITYANLSAEQKEIKACKCCNNK